MRFTSPIHPTIQRGLSCLIALLLMLNIVTTPFTSIRSAYASAPTPPAGCSTTTTFTQSTPLAIPTGPATVSSTLVVSGVNPYLTDVDVLTNLTHSFAADLDVTIQSPVGTVVTLTTDNGAGNDNVFNGTTWDDDANPAGQVPYNTNNGVVTDHAYLNLTLASPLVPEEALAAFIGEDPNGTWTFTISDDATGDGGSLDSWALTLTTAPAAFTTTTTTSTQSTPLAIPTGPAVVSSTLVVSGVNPYLTDVDVLTNLTHTFAADLDMSIQSPAGTVVTLTSDNGAGNDNVFNGTTWDDGANPAGQVPYNTNNGLVNDHAYLNLTLASPLVPEEALAAFIGEDPNGTWVFTISDDLAGDGGSLDSWSLTLTTAGACVEIVTLGNGQTITDGDITPATADLTDFGSVAVGQTITHTFTISNTGIADLLLTGPSAVILSTAADFIVTVQPTSPVSSNTTTTFQVAFSPTAAGNFTDTVSIANNDSDENPYTFVIAGTGTIAPEIAISGNGQTIANGDATPATSDDSDFGSLLVSQAITHTFTISNIGTADLNLTDPALVTIIGQTGTDFSVVASPTALPTTPIAPNTTTTFQVRFNPTSTGIHTATLSIANDDSNENPYTFVIQGMGTPTPLNYVFLPMMATPPGLPDLVVEQIRTADGRLEVTIKNNGQAPVTNPFWVDVYINPRSVPTGVNQVWQLIGERGLVWGVTTSIPAGGSLTLTVGETYYNSQLSAQGGTITTGTRLYAQVDSANTESTDGGVLESHERDGGLYNNISTTEAVTNITELAAAPTKDVSTFMPARPK